MRFEHVSLKHFKPYDDADLDLDRGVSVVYGPNGAGKSSLLEACFFALYGAKALDDATLDDLVTKGQKECTVELAFVHDDDDYRVHRRLRATGERARTVDCVLETPEGSVEGAKAVRRRVEGMVRMDADAFVNCAYVRQGEVNKLIHASPAKRQDTIDDLLQLGKLETYRDRAGEARLGVEDVLSGQRDVVENLAEQIRTKERKDLPATLNELETERAAVGERISNYEEQRRKAESTRDDAREIIETYEDKREELADVESDIEDLRSAIAETEREREALKSKVSEQRSRREELESERATLVTELELDDADSETVATERKRLDDRDEALRDRIEELRADLQETVGEVERLRERARELDAEAEEAREVATDLEETIEDREAALREARKRREQVTETLTDLRGRFDDAPVAVGDAKAHRTELRAEREELDEELGEVRTDLKSRRERIAEAERLLEEGKCPECGQPVADSPHVDRLETDRERVDELNSRLETLRAARKELTERIETATDLVETERAIDRKKTERKNLEELVTERESALTEDKRRLDEVRDRAKERAVEAETKREAATDGEETATELREEVASLNADRGDVRERADRVDRVAELTDTLDSLVETVETLQERRAGREELNNERRDRLTDLRERRDALRKEYDEKRVERAREDQTRAEDYLEKVEAKLDHLDDRREELDGRIGAVGQELDELDDLRDRHEAVVTRVDALESLYEEAEELETTYGALRADLRQANVETLERMLNETFELVYENDSYATIDLDGDYELTVYQKDGEALDPEQLSGGERALFNLSLRCAIYRLLAEGIEGTAPLPPLILDEPTVFLDSGHVSRLVDLIDSMRRLGVEQIVVVTHDEELVGAADSVIGVEKDPTTNRSTVGRVDSAVASLD